MPITRRKLEKVMDDAGIKSKDMVIMNLPLTMDSVKVTKIDEKSVGYSDVNIFRISEDTGGVKKEKK